MKTILNFIMAILCLLVGSVLTFIFIFIALGMHLKDIKRKKDEG